jgi:hypothetical protein
LFLGSSKENREIIKNEELTKTLKIIGGRQLIMSHQISII